MRLLTSLLALCALTGTYPGPIHATEAHYRPQTDSAHFRILPDRGTPPLEMVGIQEKGTSGLEPRPHRRLLLAEYGNTQNRFVEIGPDGKMTWEFRPPSISVIFQILPHGHIMLGYGGAPTGVQEIDRGAALYGTT